MMPAVTAADAATPPAPDRQSRWRLTRRCPGGAVDLQQPRPDRASNLRQAGEAGRRVAVVGTMRNAGTTYAAISLARALAKDASVVLVDFAFGAPNLSVISTEPQAPGIAELIRGTASFGDIITRDQYSNVHLVATGNVGNDAAALAASPMLATVIEALVHSYDHVVIDAGSAPDVAVERFAPLAPHAVLVAGDPGRPATRAARERLTAAGFADVTLIAGGAHGRRGCSVASENRARRRRTVAHRGPQQ